VDVHCAVPMITVHCAALALCALAVACCPLVSHGEYTDGTDGDIQTDGRQTVTLRFPLDAATVITRDVIIP